MLLIEEPELYLSPQAQRHLYRRLRELGARGNQVLYSTHASSFLSVAHLDELALVRHRPGAGTALSQPPALPSDESFRALAEFDAERAELFLSRAALLVEGVTEKLVFPFVFDRLGYEPDREAIAILETGGKANMPLYARICNECGIPYVVVHDRDAPRGQRPNESERITNAAIREIAGKGRVVQLAPDFESVVGLTTRRQPPPRGQARTRLQALQRRQARPAGARDRGRARRRCGARARYETARAEGRPPSRGKTPPRRRERSVQRRRRVLVHALAVAGEHVRG